MVALTEAYEIRADSEEGRDVIRKNGTVAYLEGLKLMKDKLQESRQARQDNGLR